MAFKKFLAYVTLIGLFFIGESVGNAVDNFNTSQECVPTYKCKTLFCISINGRRSLKEGKLLNESICEQIGENIKVFCPRKDVSEVPMQNHICSNVLQEMRTLPTLKECGYVGATNRVFGGSETAMHEFPWTALLMYKIETDSDILNLGCGGSLINRYYVLTAAHCVISTLILVRLGEWNLLTEIDTAELNKNIKAITAPPSEDISISRQVIHPKYNETGEYDNDIALLQLDRKVDFTPYISPICLPMDVEQRMKRYNDIFAYVAGWGQGEKKSYSEVKLKAIVKIIDNDKCKIEYLSSKMNISEKQMCAIGSKMDAGKGDSGGGLIVTNTVNGKIYSFLAGITSGGIHEYNIPEGKDATESIERKARMGIYVHVGSYMKWIIENLTYLN